ncbi:MAG TPA: DivIVA domain-containing protein [Brachybacterium sp.]|nr:DivIVA domain-containing protein [Brachybacterium sp.]
MSTSFERVSRFSVGYDMREVDEFLSRARKAYEGRDPSFDGSDITAASFGTERGGYDMRVVDEALDRLSDAFALQARDGSGPA